MSSNQTVQLEPILILKSIFRPVSIVYLITVINAIQEQLAINVNLTIISMEVNVTIKTVVLLIHFQQTLLILPNAFSAFLIVTPVIISAFVISVILVIISVNF